MPDCSFITLACHLCGKQQLAAVAMNSFGEIILKMLCADCHVPSILATSYSEMLIYLQNSELEAGDQDPYTVDLASLKVEGGPH